MNKLPMLRTQLRSLGSTQKATAATRFFKTGPGQYGEGDKFLGVTMPQQRQLAKQYKDLSLTELDKLLASAIHEERSIALIILVTQFKQADESSRETIYNFYLSHTERINNWDLVDGSAEFIMGPWLHSRDKSVLTQLAMSGELWERRIAMLTTFHNIKQGNPIEALKIAELLLHDPHDLIQKAVGWMLREIGKRCSQPVEEAFSHPLQNYAAHHPALCS